MTQPFAICLALGTAWLTTSLRADEMAGTDPPLASESAVPIPFTGLDPAGILGRLRSKDQAQLQDLLKKYAGKPQNLFKNSQDLKDFSDLRKKGLPAIDPDDPLVQQLRKALEGQHGRGLQGLTPEQQKALKEFVDSFPRVGQSGGPSNRPNDDGSTPLKQKTGPKEDHLPGAGYKPVSPPSERPALPADVQAENREATEWLLKQLQKIQGPLRRTPGFQQALRDLQSYALRGNSRAGGWGAGTNWYDFARFLRSASGHSFWSSPRWAALPRFSVPAVPHMSVPLPRWSLGGFPVVAPVRMGTPHLPSPQAAVGLVWLALFVCMVILVWILFGQHIRGARRTLAAAWKLGPWPVDPSAVANREQLIQAFEYLALLKLGSEARAWNHLELAVGLGADDATGTGERSAAADHLASLYEQARYAPGNDLLALNDLEAARREFLLLTGTSA